nr:hypothetical protein [Tanacetum cinerariifolium]
DKGSDSTDEMSHVLGSLGATNILASGDLRSVFTTASLLVATASTCISPAVATASGSFPTALIFTTTNLDRGNEMVTKYLSKYEQAEAGLSHDEKTAEALGTEPSQEQQSEEPKELSEEELKKMMKLVPVEELYIEALQVKYPIIN